MTLAFPGVTGPVSLSFENQIAAREAETVAQAYRYFAQIVSLEVR